jgi:transcription elongation factor Elf1
MTDKQNVKLLPCPFCGDTKPEIVRFGTGRQSTQYQCTNCHCSLETGETWGFDAWNTRAEIPKQVDNSKPLTEEEQATIQNQLNQIQSELDQYYCFGDVNVQVKKSDTLLALIEECVRSRR